METLQRSIRLLYTGRSRRAQWFRYALVGFDTLTIVYFILSVTWPQTGLLTAVDTGLGLLILADLAARFWISEDRRKECLRLYTIADLLVVASLLLAPIFTDDLAFLRILRALHVTDPDAIIPAAVRAIRLSFSRTRRASTTVVDVDDTSPPNRPDAGVLLENRSLYFSSSARSCRNRPDIPACNFLRCNCVPLQGPAG